MSFRIRFSVLGRWQLKRGSTLILRIFDQLVTSGSSTPRIAPSPERHS